MTATSISDTLEPYIHTQRAYLFRPTVGEVKLALSASNRLREAHSRQSRDWKVFGDKQEAWATDDLIRHFVESGASRMCLVNEAGMGKTIALQRAKVVLAALCDDQLVAIVEIGKIRRECADEDTVLSMVRRDILAELTRANITSPFQNLSTTQQDLYLRNRCEKGTVALLFDGLDHTQYYAGDSESYVTDPRIRAIGNFLNLCGPKTRVVFSGRPSAVLQHWDAVGIDEKSLIAQMAYFDEEDQKNFLGEACFDRLQLLDIDFLSIPRALSTVRQLYESGARESDSLSALNDLRNAADVYFRAVEELLKAGLANSVRKADLPNAVAIFSAIGFHMAVNEKDCVNYDEMERGYLSEVYISQTETLQRRFKTYDVFEDAVKLLQTYNEGWEHSLFENAGLNLGIYWRDKTLRDFFAALYAIRSDANVSCDALWERTLSSWQKGLLQRRQGGADVDNWYWIWRFIFEADTEYLTPWLRPSRPRWIHIATKLLGHLPNHGIRFFWSEMVFRAWPQLERLANEGDANAKQALGIFQLSFTTLLRKGDAIAKGLIHKFVALHKSGGDTAWSILSFPVTNREYQLFDSSHPCEERHLDCPVVNVTYFDASAFCSWISNDFVESNQNGAKWRCALPTYDQWSLACTAGEGDNRKLDSTRMEDSQLRAKIESMGYCVGAESCYRAETNAATNDWGLRDMRGNVSEWVQDQDSGQKGRRLACGGSFRQAEISKYLVDRDRCDSYYAGEMRDDVGFRPVMSMVPSDTTPLST